MDQQMNNLFRLFETMERGNSPNGNSDPFTMLETLLPFLPEENQRMFSKLTQMTALSKSITGDYYQSLGLLRPHLPPKTQRMIDLFLKIIELNVLLNEIFSSGGSRMTFDTQKTNGEEAYGDRYPEAL